MKFETFLICDDIRTETNNKVSLMGLYDDKILFLAPNNEKISWPRQMQIAAFAKVTFEESDKLDSISTVRILFVFNHYETEILSALFPSDKKQNRDFIKIKAVYPNFTFPEPGILTLKLEFFDKEGNKISELTPNRSIKVTDSIENG